MFQRALHMDPFMHWQTSRFLIDLRTPKVMGIVNVTPDSFSDGGQYASQDAALAHCDRLLKDGADMLDIGGESTRPGALELPVEDELARVLPIIRHAVTLGVPVSVDTYKPAVMQAALDLGADIINDIWALRWRADGDSPTGQQVVSTHPNCGVCLMHMHREPQTMQLQPMQGDTDSIIPQVLSFLEQRRQSLCRLGVDLLRIVVDPGIGFGKTTEQNFSLLANQREFLALGVPLLAGWSRKTAIGAVTGLQMSERVAPSVVAAVLAVQNGASIVRVHDVRETAAALKVVQAVNQNKN